MYRHLSCSFNVSSYSVLMRLKFNTMCNINNASEWWKKKISQKQNNLYFQKNKCQMRSTLTYFVIFHTFYLANELKIERNKVRTLREKNICANTIAFIIIIDDVQRNRRTRKRKKHASFVFTIWITDFSLFHL